MLLFGTMLVFSTHTRMLYLSFLNLVKITFRDAIRAVRDNITAEECQMRGGNKMLCDSILCWSARILYSLIFMLLNYRHLLNILFSLYKFDKITSVLLEFIVGK